MAWQKACDIIEGFGQLHGREFRIAENHRARKDTHPTHVVLDGCGANVGALWPKESPRGFDYLSGRAWGAIVVVFWTSPTEMDGVMTELLGAGAD